MEINALIPSSNSRHCAMARKCYSWCH